MAAVLGGGYIRNRVASLWPSPYSQLPALHAPDTEKPVEHVQRVAVVKYVFSWMVALIHGWALLDRMDDLADNSWRLVKPAAWLLAWVRTTR